MFPINFSARLLSDLLKCTAVSTLILKILTYLHCYKTRAFSCIQFSWPQGTDFAVVLLCVRRNFVMWETDILWKFCLMRNWYFMEILSCEKLIFYGNFFMWGTAILCKFCHVRNWYFMESLSCEKLIFYGNFVVWETDILCKFCHVRNWYFV